MKFLRRGPHFRAYGACASRFLGEMVLRREPAGKCGSYGVVPYRLLLACALVFALPAGSSLAWSQAHCSRLCGRIRLPSFTASSRADHFSVGRPAGPAHLLRGRHRGPARPACRPSCPDRRRAAQPGKRERKPAPALSPPAFTKPSRLRAQPDAGLALTWSFAERRACLSERWASTAPRAPP